MRVLRQDGGLVVCKYYHHDRPDLTNNRKSLFCLNRFEGDEEEMIPLFYCLHVPHSVSLRLTYSTSLRFKVFDDPLVVRAHKWDHIKPASFSCGFSSTAEIERGVFKA